MYKDRPRVFFDGYPLENQAQRGIARVVTESISRSSNAVDYTIGHENPLLYPVAGVTLRTCKRTPNRKGLLARLGIRKGLPPEFPIAEGEFDIYHSAYFLPSPIGKIHKIQHVYDMIPELLPDVMGRWGRIEAARKAIAINQADTLICISHSTKASLLRVYPQLRKRIEVVPLGGEHLCRDQKSTHQISTESYLLYVGHRTTYKNFDILWKAMSNHRWPKEHRLLVVGALPTEDERSLAESYVIKDKIEWLGHVSDERLASLYNRATAFVFPSLMEGFGLPVIESQLNACPLIASDIPIFREIAGDGAIFFSPHDPESLLDAVQIAIAEKPNLIQRGLTNAARYSWTAAATKLISIYESCRN